MRTYAHVCLVTFGVAFAGVWVAVQLFLGLTLIAVFLTQHPYLPWGLMGRVLPDLLVQALPLSICFATLLAGVLATHAVHRRQGLLWMTMGGAPLLRPWVSVLATGLVLSGFLLWLLGDVLPVANYRLRYLELTAGETPATLALRLAEAPTSLGRFHARVRKVRSDEMADVALTSQGGHGATVLAARRGRAHVTTGGQHLRIRLDDGRLLRLDEAGELSRNLRFGALNLRFDVRRVSQRSKRSLLSLKHYTNKELDRVPGQYRELRRKGWPVGERARRRVQVVDAVRALRVQAGLLPVLLLLLAVTFLGHHVVAGRTYLVAGVLAVGLLLLLQHALLDVRSYKHGREIATWAVFLPTWEVLALCGLRLVGPYLRRLVRRAR